MSEIKIVEVGPRDGLQNEKNLWSVADRITFIDLLSDCGFSEIEVGSFVSPKWVPQMADTDLVFSKIRQKPGIMYSCLVPNEKGLETALACGVRNISVFTAASEAFNQKNINCSIEESFSRFIPIMSIARELGIRVRGYVSCAIECPYEGAIDPLQVVKVTKRLSDMGCNEISLGDTIGKGTPETIYAMIKAVKETVPMTKIAIHCHDTYGTAMDNIFTAINCGIKTVDSAMGGLGGCPYGGQNAKGNVATELVVKELQRKGYILNLNHAAIEKASQFVSSNK